MTKSQIIAYLRQSCIVQDPETTPLDPVFLDLTDAQIELVLTVAMSSESPEGSLENIQNDIVYPLILVAKKELYFQLATNSAPLYPLDAGDDGGLKKNIRFDHYMSLITKVDSEYSMYKDTQTPIVTGNIKLASKYYTERNYNLADKPQVTMVADLVSDVYIDLSWILNKVDRFANYVLYLHTSQIVDLYNTTSVINTEATRVAEITNIHETLYRLNGLTKETEYHIAIAVQEKNGLKGFSEITVTTLL